MAYFLLFLIVAMIFPCKYYDKCSSVGVDTVNVITKYNLLRHITGTLVGVVVIACFGIKLHFNSLTLLISFMYSLMLVVAIYLTIYAYQHTTVAITSIFCTASLIVPIIFGTFLFGDTITISQIFWIILMFVGIYFITSTNEKSEHKFTIKVFFVLVAILVVFGLGSVSMQLFTNYVPMGDPAVFMFFAYVFATLILLVLMPFVSVKGQAERKAPVKSYVFGALAAVFTYLSEHLMTTLTAHIPSPILFTVVNGSYIIGAALVGTVWFKERLTIKNIAGIIIATVSIILINLI